MRFACAGLVVLAASFGGASARADHQPALIVPGNPKVPVVIDGHDVSWAVVEGDWGLYRPGHVAPTVIYPIPVYVDYWHTRGYFPRTGKRPRYGRHEIIPPANRRLPPPAESFHRYWSTHPDHVPVHTYTEYPMFDPPPVITAPAPLRKLN